jgi:hypothetical protein
MAELLFVPDYDGAIFVPEHVGDFLCALAFEVGQLEAGDELGLLREQLKMVEAERDVWSGKACEEEQAKGNGPCGGCRHCLPELVVQLRKEKDEARRAARWSISGDQPLKPEEEKAIEAAHPMRSGRHDVYAEALCIVEAKQSKYGLVGVVNWLLHERLALRGASSFQPGAEAEAEMWRRTAMDAMRKLDTWGHDAVCSRRVARVELRSPVPCDCNLESTLAKELCTLLDQEKK